MCATALLLLSACSKDDDDAIVGSWTLDRIEVINGSTNVTITQKETFTFYADGTYLDVYDDGRDKGTYTISNDRVTFVDEDGDYSVLEIKKLSKKELILFREFGDKNDPDYASNTFYFKKK